MSRRKAISLTREQAANLRWAIGYLCESNADEGGDHASVPASQWESLLRADDALADAFGWKRGHGREEAP